MEPVFSLVSTFAAVIGALDTVGGQRRRSMNLTSKIYHLVAQHYDLDGTLALAATDEPDQLNDTAEGSVEEREGHRRMFAESGARR
jgi:hypothetical protein